MSAVSEKRRWLQFRLSTFAVLFFVLAVGLSAYRRYVAYQALDVISRNAEFVRPYPKAQGFRRFWDDSIYRVHHLSFHGKGMVTDEDIAHVAKLRSLNRLSLHRTSTTDKAADMIAGLTNLEALSFERTGITDAAMISIAKLKNLKTLSLSYTGITDAALDYIAELSKLEELRLKQTSVSHVGLAKLSKLKKLKYIEITRCREADMIALSKLTSLETLHVQSCSSSSVLPHLAKLQKLRSIRVMAVQAPPEYWGSFPDLEHLHLSRSGSVRIRAHPKLKSLNVHIWGHGNSVDLRDLAGLESLKVVSGGQTATLVSNAPQLREMELHRSEVMLERTPSLERLWINGYNREVSISGPLPRLRFAEITANSCDAQAIQSLERATQLRRLQIAVHSPNVANQPKFSWERLAHLDHLRLHGLDLSQNDFSVLNTNLRYLALVDGNIADAKFIGWQAMPQLERLSLASNRITDAGLARIPAMPRLQTVSVQGNLIRGEGLEALLKLPQIRRIIANEHNSQTADAAEYGPGLDIETVDGLGWKKKLRGSPGRNLRSGEIEMLAGKWRLIFDPQSKAETN